MIEVKNLIKEFKVDGKVFRAVDDVSFTVNKGEVYGVIGLSGAGKSTLIRCLNRLEEPTSGTVSINGTVLNTLGKNELNLARRDIGMIFQSFNLFNQRTVAENIAYPLQISGMAKEKIKKEVDDLLDFIDLKDKKNSYPSEISGGQKQRVAIARALATKPQILLSDESTSALDPANTEQILNLLKRAVERYGMTIIMITHQMEVAKNICDRIAVMEHGKIIEENTVENIFNFPRTERTKSFIRSLPDVVAESIFNPEDFSGRLFRLTFSKENSKKPVVNDLMKNSSASINILSGNLNTLKTGGVVGNLTIELGGSEEEIEDALRYLSEEDVIVEVL